MKRSKHSLSHYRLCTCNMGQLIPITWYEGLPGDTIQHSISLLLRATPLTSPVMHPVRVRLHTFFVPNRIIWDEWEDFITGGKDGLATPTHPHFSQPAILQGSAQDHMGVPIGEYSPELKFSALPFRAYNLIYNEYFRDQDLIDEVVIFKGSGEDTQTPRLIQQVSWEKDYFTTARPWTSKGEEIFIPIGDTAPLVPTETSVGLGIPTFDNVSGGRTGQNMQFVANESETWWQTSGADGGMAEWNEPGLVADLTEATGISVNDLRNFLALQRYQEARARFGSRYSEYLKYLVPGIGNLDSRLQEPEYVSGGSSTISFSEILQTAQDDIGSEQSPVGTMRGHGISAMRTRRSRKFVQEHGIFMTLLSVVPKAIYSQQLDRKWSRELKEHYFQKELQFIGEQPIYNKEVYAQHSEREEVFGYNQRYDEYRYIPSRISGEFHDEQDNWHYARVHDGDVGLNQTFIECVPNKRPHADTEGDSLYVMANNSIQARRIISKWPTPKTF